MKKIMPLVASIALILIAGIFASAGILAQFSDTETVSVADIQAGTLDLKLLDKDAVVHVTIPNIKPGQGGSSTWHLTNTGSLNGILSIEITNVVNKENGRNDPEIEAGDAYGDLDGELGAHLNIKIKITDSDGTKTWPIAGDRWAKVNDVAGNTYAVSGTPGTLKAGEKESIWFAWNLPDTVGNIIQGDSVEFDIIFHLDQA